MNHDELERNKQIIIQTAKILVAQTSFATVADYADTLFDLPQHDEEQINKHLHFLQNTTLDEVEYSNLDTGSTFILGKRNSEEHIYISNRNSISYELRGQAFRQLLEQNISEKAQETLYDVIAPAVRRRTSSDTIICFRSMIIDKPYNMNPGHFDLFLGILFEKIDEKKKNKVLEDTLTSRDIAKNERLQERIWQNIDVDAIYDTSLALFCRVDEMKTLSEALQKRHHLKTAQCALTLYRELQAKHQALGNKHISLGEFAQNYHNALDQAAQGKLKKHRNFFSKSWRAMSATAHHFFHAIPAIEGKPANSVKQINNIKKALTEMMHAIETPSNIEATVRIT